MDIELTKTEKKTARARANERANPKRSAVGSILFELLANGGAMHRQYYHPGKSLSDIKDATERAYFLDLYKQERQAIQYQKKMKRLIEQRIGDEIIFTLTEKGEQQAIREMIIECEILLPTNQYIGISFDIAESTRSQRDSLRYFLKSADFWQFHQSLWITNKDVLALCQILLDNEGLAGSIRVFELTLLDDDKNPRP